MKLKKIIQKKLVKVHLNKNLFLKIKPMNKNPKAMLIFLCMMK